MVSFMKIIYVSCVMLIVLIASISTVPVPDHAKIRIHVPVKHHTHLITKTLVKTVHVGIPIKQVKLEDDHEETWSYPKKKKYHSYI